MEYSITPITHDDREAVMDIFNHYVEHSFAAYPETPLPYQAFDMLLQMAHGLPTAIVKDRSGNTLGFAMLRPHNPIPAFSRTAELTAFIHPDHTGNGLGKLLLDSLEQSAAAHGIATLLASISSRNPGSIAFHKKNGFVECGRFRDVGKKKGQLFDTMWMQKAI